MIDTKTLSIKEKITLLNKLYEDLSGHGIGGDTELAHINPWEADLLRSVGGAGTVNEVTGLRQYLGGGGSSPPPQPTQTTTRQVPEYAPEQREYIEDIFGKSQELYEQRTAEGFQPFPGQQLAPFAAQEEEAFRGIESLARGPGAAPAFEIARNAALGAAAPITSAEIQQGMNPYQQMVTDVAKREAARQYSVGPQAQFRSGAVESGGLRGARRFIEETEGQRNLQQQMSDLQTVGSQQAFQQSMAEAAAARGRLANLAAQMPSIGTGAYQQQLAQYGQLGGVGEAYRARQQAAIDLAQQQFQQEHMFPEETLATYLRFITNAPSPSGFQQTTQRPGVPGPSTLTQLTSGLAGGATLGKAFGLFNRGGAVPPASGRQAGLSGIVRRAGGGQIVRMQPGGFVRETASPFIQDIQRMQERGAEVTQRNLERAEQLREDAKTYGPVPEAAEYLFGTPEGLEEIKNLRREATIDPNMELVAGLELEEETPVVEEKPAAEKPAGKAASFRVLPPAEAKPTETKSAFLSGLDNLSTGDLLKLSGAFFQAGSQGSTGNPFGDLTQFLGSAGVTSGDVINAAEKRKLAAEDKKFLLGLKEREVKAAENKGTAALLAVGKDTGEFKTPTTKDLEFTKAILQDGPYKKVSDAAVRQISQIQKKYDKYSPQEIAAMLQASGALVVDDTGFWSFIGGGTPTLQTAGE